MAMWVILSITAAAIWAICNIIDKFVLSKYIKNPIITTLVFSIVNLASSGFLICFVNISLPSSILLTGCLIGGTLYFAGICIYFVALKHEETSKVVSLLFMKPLFVLLLASMFLGETLTVERLIGFSLLLFSSLLLSIEKTAKIKISKTFFMMVISDLILATSCVITKYLLHYIDYWNVFFWERIGTFIGSIPVIYLYLSKFIDIIKHAGSYAWGYMSISEILNLIALFLSTIAISAGPVSLVSALISVQPLFSFIYAVLIGLYIPDLREKTDTRTLCIKLTSFIFIIIGGYFVAY